MATGSRYGIGRIVEAAAVVVVLLVAILAVGGYLASQSPTPPAPAETTPSGQSSSISQQSTSSTTQSSRSTSATSNSPLAITVTQAISDPPEAGTGNSMYIYDVTLADNGQSSYSVDLLYFTMVTASNSVYDATVALAFQHSLPVVTLNPGQKTSGQVAFQFPRSETPSKLEYKVPFSVDEFITNLPTPTIAVSEPNFAITTNVQGTTNAYGGQDLTAFSSIQNTTFYFYTGQAIAIKVALTNFDTGTTVTVNSITVATAGLSISQISPSLPITVSGSSSGNETDVVVYIPAPPTSFSGTIALSVSGTG